MTSITSNSQLAHAMAQYYADPLSFVLMAYPWGVKGTPLENEEGPDANQKQSLIDLGAQVKVRRFRGVDPVMPILMSVSSGHGTGKSVLGAWIANWILSTRPHSIGTVTANTFKQLESRTWAAIRLWTKLCITAHWFDIRLEKCLVPEFRTRERCVSAMLLRDQLSDLGYQIVRNIHDGLGKLNTDFILGQCLVFGLSSPHLNPTTLRPAPNAPWRRPD